MMLSYVYFRRKPYTDDTADFDCWKKDFEQIMENISLKFGPTPNAKIYP